MHLGRLFITEESLKTPLFVLIAALFVLTLSTASVNAQRHPDRIKATKHLTGKLAGFEVGDYTHALVKPVSGENQSFFVGGGESLLYFLVAHQGDTVKITYQEVSSWIEEAGGYTDIERITAAQTTGGQTHTAWWAAERKTSSLTKLRKKYDALLEKATVTN
jgi:hypothetical protein